MGASSKEKNNMGRDIRNVIDRMVKIVPRLSLPMEEIKDSYHYTAPEAMSRLWDRAANVLNRLVPEDHPKFKQISDIFAGREN